MPKNKLSIYIIVLSGFSVLAVFILILQNSYAKILDTKKTTIDKTFTSTFNPVLDIKILDLIKSKDTILPSESPNYETSNYVPPVVNTKAVTVGETKSDVEKKDEPVVENNVNIPLENVSTSSGTPSPNP